MKYAGIAVFAAIVALPAMGQGPAGASGGNNAQTPAPIGREAQQVKMECRDLASSGNYIEPDETVVNGRACRPEGTPLDRTPKLTAGNTVSMSRPSSERPPAASPSTPVEPGMYIATSDAGFAKILGQIIDFKRTGSLLVSKATLGLKTSKQNVHNAGDLILVRLEEKKERRQFEVGAQGAWRASEGISLTHQVQISRSEVKSGVYEITPAAPLGRGEYGLYLLRGEGMSPYIYDFSVQ